MLLAVLERRANAAALRGGRLRVDGRRHPAHRARRRPRDRAGHRERVPRARARRRPWPPSARSASPARSARRRTRSSASTEARRLGFTHDDRLDDAEPQGCAEARVRVSASSTAPRRPTSSTSPRGQFARLAASSASELPHGARCNRLQRPDARNWPQSSGLVAEVLGALHAVRGVGARVEAGERDRSCRSWHSCRSCPPRAGRSRARSGRGGCATA